MISGDIIFYRFLNVKYNRNVSINRIIVKVNKKLNSVKDEVFIILNSCIESYFLLS